MQLGKDQINAERRKETAVLQGNRDRVPDTKGWPLY